MIRGILPVIPTPLADGRFDPRSFERLLDHILPFVDGYTLLGSTGESPSLDREQRIAITEAALALTPATKTVIVGVSHTSVDEAIQLARHAQSVGAGGVLCAAPYYFDNSSVGLQQFLSRLDACLDIDLVLYDNPAPTNTRLDVEDIIQWADSLEHLRTVKLTDHDLSKIDRLRDADVAIMAGDDSILFRYLAAGVDGVMVIAPTLFPAEFQTVWELVGTGDLRSAYEMFARRILPFLHVFGIGDEIATTKAMLNMLGIFASSELLPPLAEVGEGRRRLLQIAYGSAIGDLREAVPSDTVHHD